jgi:hypothetical protein
LGRLNQRQGFLVSAIVHMAILMALARHTPEPMKPQPVPPMEVRERVFLPAPEVLRGLL